MQIKLDKNLDEGVYVAFHNYMNGGVDFGKNKIERYHPNINMDNYMKYIDNFYRLQSKELEDARTDTQKCFDEIKEVLFSELQSYFGTDYSKKEYFCFLSIFDCNPRYLETKSFQVYYKRPHEMKKEVIAHELTHFAFYDFCASNGLGSEKDKTLWELSEIFNLFFLNIPSMQKTIGMEELLFYPELKDKAEKIQAIWQEKRPAKEFITESLMCLNSLSEAEKQK